MRLRTHFLNFLIVVLSLLILFFHYNLQIYLMKLGYKRIKLERKKKFENEIKINTKINKRNRKSFFIVKELGKTLLIFIYLLMLISIVISCEVMLDSKIFFYFLSIYPSISFFWMLIGGKRRMPLRLYSTRIPFQARKGYSICLKHHHYFYYFKDLTIKITCN